MNIKLVTNRLILRPWMYTDAPSLYKYAHEKRVALPAGWPAHKNIDDSTFYLNQVFMQKGVFAIVRKDDTTSQAIGCIGLLCGGKSNLDIPFNEGEISYWLGLPFWGKGYVPEAVNELIKYGFEQLGLKKIWAGFYTENKNSKRVLEKCGFNYVRTEPNKYNDLIDEVRTEQIYCKLPSEKQLGNDTWQVLYR